MYRRIDIGTAKTEASAHARVPHYLIDLIEQNEDFGTNRWCSSAAATVG